jgi:surface polysaccharide O-acyltransferase-like enzyme
MVTGFLLLQPSKTNEPLRVFFKKRWAKIGIPVLFWAGIYLAWRAFIYGNVINLTVIVQSLFAGPYEQFWFIYLLIGLYLLTPIIRVVVAHADWKLIKYFLAIWFISAGVMPLLGFVSAISSDAGWFNQTVLSFFNQTGMVGYFILGAFVYKFHVRKSILILTFILSSAFTIFGTYFLVLQLGGNYLTYFYQYPMFNVILASVSLFLLFAVLPAQKIKIRLPTANKVIQVIGSNTLGIFLVQFIVLETLQKGYLMLKINVVVLNPIVSIPLVSAATLFICVAIIVPLKKIPYVRRIF